MTRVYLHSEGWDRSIQGEFIMIASAEQALKAALTALKLTHGAIQNVRRARVETLTGQIIASVK